MCVYIYIYLYIYILIHTHVTTHSWANTRVATEQNTAKNNMAAVLLNCSENNKTYFDITTVLLLALTVLPPPTEPYITDSKLYALYRLSHSGCSSFHTSILNCTNSTD